MPHAQKPLSLWTVYSNPSDYPNHFVARRFELDKPTTSLFVSEDLGDIRRWIREQAAEFGQGAPVIMPRDPADDPCILETWL